MSKLKSLVVATALVCTSFSASAGIVTLMGDDVTFTFEDSTLYGNGTVVGNSIFFAPTNFQAESLNGEGTVTEDQTLNVRVQVKDESTYTITEVVLAEQGDYLLNGAGTSVDASARLQVTSNTTTCGFFACTDSEIDNVTGLGTTGALTEWQAFADIDLAETAGWVFDTDVNANIQNNLSATTTQAATSAMIEKKFGAIGIEVTVVPVPAAVWLFMSALGLLGSLRMRRTG
ncbi:MAG: hypothetical protein HKN56_05430 [Gammaproteobacteria bacterium]|nr:hypothetical protein [Gammaproteobacteria bacterium]